jgi:tetratricopeptide (TPR) repeat protein/transcriptional regulator with XRE-family HTH domain
MLQQQTSYRNTTAPPLAIHLGAFLKMLRDRHGIAQAEVLKHLPGWQQSAYSKVEKDTRAPTFDQLVPIYSALAQAGVQLTLQDRQQFLLLARRKIESMKTRHERQSDSAWEELQLALVGIDRLPEAAAFRSPAAVVRSPLALKRETGHLVGRETWLDALVGAIKGEPPMKVIILQGPPGSGKTSELHRVADYFLRSIPRSHVVLCEPPSLDQELVGPDIVLELLLGEILDVVGSPLSSLPATNLRARVKYVLDCLAKADRSVLLVLDHAEHLLTEQGELAAVWEQFLTEFVQARHHASLVLATREWPARFIVETPFVMHTMVPPLSKEEGEQVLRRLGLHDMPQEVLGAVVEAVGGIPLCLEWAVKLVLEPWLRDDWAVFEEEEERAKRLAHLLEDSSLFGGPIATRLQPLLERVIKRLSPEAQTALRELAVSPIPLGSPALKALYRNPAPLKELRDASLLVAYLRRVQLLPMVADLVGRTLTSDQVRLAQDRLIQALTHWLNTGITTLREQGEVFTGLACLLLRRHRLLAAAELVLYHGWLASQVGQMLRLARLVRGVLEERPWDDAPEAFAATESGGIFLHYYLSSYLGVSIDAKERAEAYERIRAAVAAGQVTVEPLMEVHLMDQIMLSQLNEERFEEAQRLFEECFCHVEPLLSGDAELHATLLSKQAMFCSRRSGYAKSQGKGEDAMGLREEAIAIYERCLRLLEEAEHGVGVGTLRQSTLKKKRATILNNLAYQLNIVRRAEDALEAINRCIDLKEQGYAERDSLAATYGEKSQILAALGKFQAALWLDEQARDEIRRCADAGDTMSQEESWVYQVNQGHLYLLLGRVDEAERLLREAEPHIHPRRRIFQVMAQEALAEIRRGREASAPAPFQLDWRWVKRYRELSAYDAYWWWAHAGPFTEAEQREWDQLFAPPVNEVTKGRLRGLLAQSRGRELAAALAEHREPSLLYPAIEIDAVRRRIADFLALDAEIGRDEPNAIVRRLYHGAIEEEVCFLRMIEATYDRDGERFWTLNQQLNPSPTLEEMRYALERVRQVVLQGLGREDTVDVSQQVIQVLREHFGLSLDLSSETEIVQAGQGNHHGVSSQTPHMVSAQAARGFFEAVLRENGYEGWQVVLDPNASSPRVESGLRRLFLPDSPISLEEIREYFSHELLGHVMRSVAGEHSLLGLLGMGTRGYMPTEEGFADYHERRVAALHGQAFDDSGTWLGTLAVGLASGVVTPKQTFISLFSFFEPFLLLYRLLWRNDEARPIAEQRARKNAVVRCLRTYRGVPDLGMPGVCFTKDVVYLRGFLKIERAVAKDETVLDRLAVGKVALELLPDLEELEIAAPHQSLQTIAYDPRLDEYIRSFEDGDGHSLQER